MRKYGESKTTQIMMATVLHITFGLGLRKFQADGFLLTRVYHYSRQQCCACKNVSREVMHILHLFIHIYHMILGTDSHLLYPYIFMPLHAQ